MGELRRDRKRESGFSILETLVAVSVLGISLLGMAQLVGLAVQQNAFARYSTAAISIARSKVEELKADYNQQLFSGTAAGSLTDGTHGPEDKVVQSGSEHSASRSLTVSWTVATTGLRKDVVVSVSPTGGPTQINWRSKVVQVAYSIMP